MPECACGTKDAMEHTDPVIRDTVRREVARNENLQVRQVEN